MSRVAKAPVDIASGVEVSIAGQEITVKGKNGTLSRTFNDAVEVVQEENQLKTTPHSRCSIMLVNFSCSISGGQS